MKIHFIEEQFEEAIDQLDSEYELGLLGWSDYEEKITKIKRIQHSLQN